MSRVVDPAEVWGEKAVRGPVHNWVQWCDGRAHELERGKDFETGADLHSKRSTFRQWAKRQGFEMTRVHNTVAPGGNSMTIWVQGGVAGIPHLVRALEEWREAHPDEP